MSREGQEDFVHDAIRNGAEREGGARGGRDPGDRGGDGGSEDGLVEDQEASDAFIREEQTEWGGVACEVNILRYFVLTIVLICMEWLLICLISIWKTHR